jgi:hypothetical protein
MASDGYAAGAVVVTAAVVVVAEVLVVVVDGGAVVEVVAAAGAAVAVVAAEAGTSARVTSRVGEGVGREQSGADHDNAQERDERPAVQGGAHGSRTLSGLST